MFFTMSFHANNDFNDINEVIENSLIASDLSIMQAACCDDINQNCPFAQLTRSLNDRISVTYVINSF